MQMPNATPTPNIPKCCWLDDDGPCPTPCVFDDPTEIVANCSLAMRLQAESKPKTSCQHYRAALAAEQQGPSDDLILACLSDIADDALMADYPGDVVRSGRQLLALYGNTGAQP